MKLTTKELTALVDEFLEYLKVNSLLGKTLQRSYLKTRFCSEFKEICEIKQLKTTSFATVLYYMTNSGIASRTKNNVTLPSDMSAPVSSFPDSGNGKKKRKNKLEKLASLLNQDQSNISKCVMGLEITCEQPSIETEIGNFVHKVGENTRQPHIKMVIRNSAKSHRFLMNAKILTKRSEFSLSKTITPVERIRLRPGKEYDIDVICNGNFQDVGTYTTEIMFQFSLTRKEELGTITLIRYIRFEKTNSLVDSLKPKHPYMKPKQTRRALHREVIPGMKPPSLSTDELERTLSLPRFKVPENIKQALMCNAFNQENIKVQAFKNIRDTLESVLDVDNYKAKFNYLLYLEEMQSTVDIQRYDMMSVTMVKEGSLLYLRVPGLAEKRPSVLRGDRIFATVLGQDGVEMPKEYEGFVHKVERDRIGVGFHTNLLAKRVNSIRFNVRFTVNRLPVKLAHRAVSSSLPVQYIFPKECGILYSDIKICKEKFKNKMIAENREQASAVNSIVRGKTSSVPYIIFGPPGTGKTVTMVEAIHQIVTIYEGCHILVCAPSNSSCDLLAQRLLKHVRRGNILRMHAASRNWREVPAEVKEVSNFDGTDFYFPPKKTLYDYEIIVCTLITAGRIASAKFPNDHFTHIFIDEAGQGTEPECMVPIGGVLALGGQVVLAGDPKQLGPVVLSPVAKKYGFGISFLERLMENENLYQKDETQSYDARCITKLLNNYRSREDIIKVPNESFYDNELVAVDDSKMLRDFAYLSLTDFPIVFEGVQGEDMRESNSPSYYNPQEVFVVSRYVEKILEQGECGTEIGIITPYRKQVQKIRQVINNADIKVGSVEEFQGQERKIIIISTVRSDSQHLLFDSNHRLGFLCNPKRFNVAITRAKSLLVIIGNPHLLSLDFHWKKMIDFCVENNAYRGIQYNQQEKRNADMEEIEKLFPDLKIQ